MKPHTTHFESCGCAEAEIARLRGWLELWRDQDKQPDDYGALSDHAKRMQKVIDGAPVPTDGHVLPALDTDTDVNGIRVSAEAVDGFNSSRAMLDRMSKLEARIAELTRQRDALALDLARANYNDFAACEDAINKTNTYGVCLHAHGLRIDGDRVIEERTGG